MWLFSILIFIQIVSAAVCALTIRKLYAYINQYRFGESVYTLLFGFVRLRYFVYFYALMVVVATVLGLALAFSSLST